jgi:hypothetical protein
MKDVGRDLPVDIVPTIQPIRRESIDSFSRVIHPSRTQHTASRYTAPPELPFLQAFQPINTTSWGISEYPFIRYSSASSSTFCNRIRAFSSCSRVPLCNSSARQLIDSSQISAFSCSPSGGHHQDLTNKLDACLMTNPVKPDLPVTIYLKMVALEQQPATSMFRQVAA